MYLLKLHLVHFMKAIHFKAKQSQYLFLSLPKLEKKLSFKYIKPIEFCGAIIHKAKL